MFIFIPAFRLFACLLSGSFLVTLCAQQTTNYASLSVRVADPSGGLVGDAEVSARQTETDVNTRGMTDREGRLHFPYLSVGPYEVTVRHQGFAPVRERLTLTIGSAFELPVALKIAERSTQVEVREQGALLDAARSEIAGTVLESEINELPLNGRNYLDIALLIPGVSPTNTGSNQLFAETSAVPGQGISVGSQRNFSNGFIVDGFSNNDDAAGVSGASYSVDVVNEFQVVTSGGQAEFGRALGGYVNVVTRSGTNALHGDAYGYFRNSRLNATNALSHAALPMTQAQFGASLGGPISHNRTFYFANYEGRDLNQSGLVVIPAATAAVINAKPLTSNYPGSLIFTGLYPNPVHSESFLSKVDHQVNAKDQFSVRYNLYHVDSINSRGAGGLAASTASANLYNTDQVIAFSNIATFSPRLVNETRGQFWNSVLKAPPSDPVGPAVSISGIASFGTLSGSPTARLNKLGELADNVSYQAGTHSIRVGSDFLYNADTITFPRTIRGSYSFSSLANFLAGTYNNSGFNQTFANSVVAQGNPNVGFYMQDQWAVNSRLTLNLGLRYDLQFLKTIVTDTNNVSPRAGFAWSPFASRKTIVRGGYGLFYDRVPLRALANALLSANNTTNPADLSQVSLSLSPTQSGAPVFPNILSSLRLPPGVLFNFSTMDPNIQNGYSEQGSFEIEQQLAGESTLQVGYQHVRGLHLLISVNQNVPACVASCGNNGCRPNPTYGNDSQYSSRADSHYDALHVSYLQRPVRWGNYRISYTYSKALDNVGEFFFSSPLNNFNIWQDYGRSDDDQRNRFVVDGSIHSSTTKGNSVWEHLSHGFQLTGVLQTYSALPFNITTGANTVQGTTARPVVNGAPISRNAGSGFDFLTLNARLSRKFRLTERVSAEAIAEGFNLTNHVNGVTLNGVFGTGSYPAGPAPAYQQITAVGDSRSFQIAVRIAF